MNNRALTSPKLLDAEQTGNRIRELIPLSKKIEIAAYAVTVNGLREFEIELENSLKKEKCKLFWGQERFLKLMIGSLI